MLWGERAPRTRGIPVTTTIDLNKMMAKIQALLAKADGTEFPEEATTYRAKAEQFMRDYRIEEEHLIASDQVEIAPEVHELWLGPLKDATRATTRENSGNSYYQEWYALASGAARHSGVMIHYRWKRNPDTGEYGIWAVMVGYSGDLRLAELVYTNARIVFGERLEPKVDPSLSDRENVYRLRSAGITRDRVAEMLWGAAPGTRAAQVGAWYKEECAKRGETPALDGRGISAALYRDEFARSFVDELDRRLRAARDAADSVGGALVLHGRAERIQEAFWTEFPSLRPQAATDLAERETSPAKRGRAPKPYWETAAYRKEQERRYSDVGQAARSAGRAAAADVPLDRTSPAKRVSRPVAGEIG